MNKHDSKKVKTGAIVLICMVAAIAVIYVVMNYVNVKIPDKVIVTVDGEVKFTENINENKVLKVEGYQGGYNMVKIENGKVNVYEADCSNQVCVNTDTITKSGETIVCLPHRVVVEISGSSSEVDARG